MALAPLTLQLATGQTLAVTLSGPAEAQVLGMAASGYAREKAREEVLSRAYHLGANRTPGCDYDDRLTVRMKCKEDTLYKYLSTPAKDGGLRGRRVGNRYVVTEKAVREFQGDEEPEAGN